MVSSGILRRVAPVRTGVSEELSTPIIRVTRIVELVGSSETSVLTRDARRNIPEGAILHSHSRENLKSLKANEFNISTEYSLILVYICADFFIDVLGWSATESTSTGSNYWPIVPALDDR
jgi:hypothetical protein